MMAIIITFSVASAFVADCHYGGGLSAGGGLFSASFEASLAPLQPKVTKSRQQAISRQMSFFIPNTFHTFRMWAIADLKCQWE